jgi:pimeloyl-ACP methyl ester carboxylesterase
MVDQRFRSWTFDLRTEVILQAECLEGAPNGAPHPEPAAYAKMFSGKYSHRTITGGIGHNPPQEAPQAFAEVVVDVTSES